jgi:hypothetical protein
MGKSDPDIRKTVGFLLPLFGVFIERGKWLLLLKHPILSLSMYFLKIAVWCKIYQTKWGRKIFTPVLLVFSAAIT